MRNEKSYLHPYIIPEIPVVFMEIRSNKIIYAQIIPSRKVNTILFFLKTWYHARVRSIRKSYHSLRKANPGIPSRSFVKIESNVINGSTARRIRNAKSKV